MLASITHRATIALAVSTVLAWWLVSVSTVPKAMRSFMAVATAPVGQSSVRLCQVAAFHMLNGIRHLTPGTGYGFNKVATQTGSLVCSVARAGVGIFAFVWTGHAGYLRVRYKRRCWGQGLGASHSSTATSGASASPRLPWCRWDYGSHSRSWG